MPCYADRCKQGHKPCPRRGFCFPAAPQESDQPITTPEEAQGWCRAAIALLAFAIFCAVMAARNFFF